MSREQKSASLRPKRQPDGSYKLTIEDHEYVLKCMPEGNEWVPWVIFLYRDREGNPIGTTGQGYASLKSAAEYAKKFHFGHHLYGWLNPAGKFFEVAHSQHSLLVDLNFPEANGEYEALLSRGWLIMHHGRFDPAFNWHAEITSKQYAWIEENCKRTGLPMPEICEPRKMVSGSGER